MSMESPIKGRFCIQVKKLIACVLISYRRGGSSRFCERFRVGQYSLVNLFLPLFYWRCPHAQPFVKVGRAHAPVPYGVSATGHLGFWESHAGGDRPPAQNFKHTCTINYWKMQRNDC